jgi:hypothetical protein
MPTVPVSSNNEPIVYATLSYKELTSAFTDALAGLGKFILESQFNSSQSLSVRESEGREGSTRFENRVAKAAINKDLPAALNAANRSLSLDLRVRGVEVISIHAPVATSESESRSGHDMTITVTVPTAYGSTQVTQPVNIKYAGDSKTKNNTGGKPVLSWSVLGRNSKEDKLTLLEACVDSLSNTESPIPFADYFLLSFLRGKERPALEWGVSSILTTPWSTWNDETVQYAFNSTQTFPSIQMAHRSGIAEIALDDMRLARERFVSWLVSALVNSASYETARYTLLARDLKLRLTGRPSDRLH